MTHLMQELEHFFVSYHSVILARNSLSGTGLASRFDQPRAIGTVLWRRARKPTRLQGRVQERSRRRPIARAPTQSPIPVVLIPFEWGL